jgi:hypothetical protein
MSAERIDPDDWRSVVELCRPLIEALQAELDAADWCHPSGAAWLREWLEDARGAASEGELDQVQRILKRARRKLDTEWWWWWSRGGCDFPPDRPVGERRPADQWLPLDDGCTAYALAVASEKATGEGGKSAGWLDRSSSSIFTARFGVSQ